MRGSVFSIVSGKRRDSREKERGWRESALSSCTDLFCAVFSVFDLMVSCSFQQLGRGGGTRICSQPLAKSFPECPRHDLFRVYFPFSTTDPDAET